MAKKPSEHPFVEAFVANPILVDRNSVDLVNATILHLAADPNFLGLVNQSRMAMGGADDGFWSEEMADYRPYLVTNGVLQIPIQGMLLNRFSYQFGRWATGYQYIERALARGMEDENVKAIALIVDSPGGEVAGCFELGDKMFAARSVKPIRAFAADHAYSAAYALGSAATDLIVTRSGGTGSVGVVTAHVDWSGALAQDGIKVTFIYAGSHKVDGNPYEKLPDDVKARIQERIDKIYAVFTSTVARNRKMEDQAVRDTEALTFDATDSVANGFADGIGALDEEMAVFVSEVAEAESEQMTTFTQEQMDAAVASARTEGMSAGQKAEATRFTAITGSEDGKKKPKAAMAAYTAGLTAEQAAAMLAGLPEEKAEASAPTPPAKVEGKQKSGFDAAMEGTKNPQVGAESGDDTKDNDGLSAVDGLFAAAGFAAAAAPRRN
jgi:signal peptide peptidase SppA